MTEEHRKEHQAEPHRGETPRRPEERGPTDPVVEADEESFPASDAPAWTPLHPGAPTERAD